MRRTAPAARRTSRRGGALGAALLLAAAGLSAREASAQTLGGFALDQFDPAPAGDAFFGVPSPSTPGHLTPRFAVLFDYAREPLLLGGGEAVVAEQGFLHVGASLSLADRLLLSASMPFAVLQSGDDPVVSGVTLQSPSSAEIGDLRLGARLRIAGEYRDPFQVGLGASVFLPTAASDSFAGEGAVRVHPHLVAGGRGGDDVGFVWGATGGMMVRASDNPHLVTFGAGAAITFLDEMVQVGPELVGATQLGDGDPLESPAITVQAPSRTNVELLGGAKLRVLDGLTFGAGAGPGLSGAIGTPTFRAVGLVAWAPVPKRYRPPPDRDGDRVADAVDACPDEAGKDSDDPAKRGCPLTDRDADGVADQVDACPDEKGRQNADLTRNGCPADYDRDSIADSIDACPNQKGVASADPARHGCPGELDSDLDGIADRSDACPRQKGVPSDVPSRNGCPAGDAPPKPTAVAKPGGLDLPSIRFEFGKATLPPGAEADLERLRAGLQSRPDVTRVEVQGHADEVGDPGYNQALSTQRAFAVSSWLAARGIEPRRLVSKGYGSSRPVPGATGDDARAQNRRVEIVVLEQKKP